MDYIETTLIPTPLKPWGEILISALSEIDYESFVEEGDKILAYIQASKFNEARFRNLEVFDTKEFKCDISHRTIASRNWNEEWEKNFNPIAIDDTCIIRASFHPKTKNLLEIVIDPKMSFGTGHHETTRLMIRQLSELDLKGKTLLDMGTGTGVLAVFASKKGCEKVVAIDNDPQSVENAKENFQLNGVKGIEIFAGDIEDLESRKFDIILANINRNILLSHLSGYAACLPKNGVLIISGFFESDIKDLEEVAVTYGLDPYQKLVESSWASVKFIKNC